MQVQIIPSEPALLLCGRQKNLVITDVHIGFEAGMASKRIFLGKNSATDESIASICGMIDAQKPDTVILLGDIKSSIKGITKNEWDDVPRFFEQVKKRCHTILVPGNHDSGIERLVPDGVMITSPRGMIEEDVLLLHGHTAPSANFSHVNRIIMGHLHPVFFEQDSVVNGQRVWVSITAPKKEVFAGRDGKLDILVMPSFNRYLYASHKKDRKRSISPVINKISTMTAARIFTLDGAVIGDESIIDRVV